MKKVLIVVGVLVLVLLVALVVVQLKFEAITSAPDVSHADVVGEHTSVRIVFQPLNAADYIAERIVAPQGMPAWASDKVLPREVALLCDADMESGETNLTWFINEQRLGGQIAEAVDGLNLGRQLPFISFSGGMQRNGRGVMALYGTTRIPQLVMQTVHNEWGVVQPMESLTVDGGHLLEAVLDNRDGAAYALICGLYLGEGPLKPNQFNVLDIAQGVAYIAAIRVMADIASPAQMDVALRFEGSVDADHDALQGIKFLLDQGRNEVGKLLKSQYGAELGGSFVHEGDAIAGSFTIAPFEPLLVALGVPVPAPAAEG